MFQRIKKAKNASSVEEAYNYALRLLEFRFRGEDELRGKLTEKSFTPAVIHATFAKLHEYKYVDDARLLEALIRQYKEVGLYGPVYVKQKLLQRKFSSEQINSALEDQYSADDETLVAKQFLAKQKNIDLSDLKQKQRLMQKFLRRGFRPSLVFKIFGQANLDNED